MSRLVLGINSAHADSAAALVGEQGLIAAVAEERLTRKKHCAGFPAQAVAEVMRLAGARPTDLTDIAVARDPRANLAAKLAFVARYPQAGVGRALARLRVHREVADASGEVGDALGVPAGLLNANFHQVEHHLAHIASAYFCSPLERATGVSIDGAGDFASHMLARCEGNDIHVLGRSLWPHSLGVFYTALCQLAGFDRFGEEYKVMGLAAYGVPRFRPEMQQLVRYDERRGLRLGLEYFRHHRIAEGFEQTDDDAQVRLPTLYGDAMLQLLGPARDRNQPLSDRERDLAASMQQRFEEIYLAMIDHGVRTTGCRDVVLAGGSTLNSVANGRLLTERFVDRAYFHPAASDDGTAAGAALQVMFGLHGKPRAPAMRRASLGAAFDDEAIGAALADSGLPHRRIDGAALFDTAADALAKGKIVGWFQGREEWGPRALGNRSILCHPGWPDMKATLNARVKNREPFRPFAPAVLRERLEDCFRGSHEVPFMIAVYRVRPEWRERLAAVTHEDGTARVQTVTREANEPYHQLISAFEQRTGIPVLLNTSFNENEPIVHTPAQAIDCYRRTKMDALCIGSFWLEGDDRET
jgi:carbamoyltransferase